MTITLNNLPEEKPYGCVHTAIGELFVFCISWGGQSKLWKEVGKPTEKCDPTDFLKLMVPYICFPKASLKEGQYKPANSVLTSADVSSLTKDDLDVIAKLYVENNEYLFKKMTFENRQNEKGQTVVYEKCGEIECPRHENESCTQYLFRLSVKDHEKRNKQLQEIVNSVSGFSSTLGESIKKTLALGDSLQRTMESVRPLAELRSMESTLLKIDWAEIERKREERRLQPFKELSERLDQLIDTSAQAGGFMVEANKLQTQIAGEIKSAGDETTKLSKKNIKLSLVVIVLTVVGIAVAVYTILRSDNDSATQRIEIQKHVDLVTEKLTEINNSLGVANDQAVERVKRELGVSNESLRNENLMLKAKAADQTRMIHEMKNLIERQGKKLEELEKRLIGTDPSK